MDAVSPEKRDPVCRSRIDIGGSGRTDAPPTDLDDPSDVLHLRRAPHRRGEAHPLTLDLVTPIDMSVDLDDVHRSGAPIRRDHRDRYRVIAAQHDRHGTGGEGGRACVGDPLPVSRAVGRIPRHVTGISHDNAVGNRRTIQVEIVVMAGGRVRR
jgi:hypothetical protein